VTSVLVDLLCRTSTVFGIFVQLLLAISTVYGMFSTCVVQWFGSFGDVCSLLEFCAVFPVKLEFGERREVKVVLWFGRYSAGAHF